MEDGEDSGSQHKEPGELPADVVDAAAGDDDSTPKERVSVVMGGDDDDDAASSSTGGGSGLVPSASISRSIPSKSILKKQVSYQEEPESQKPATFFLPDDDHEDIHHLGTSDTALQGQSHQLFCELEELHECKDGHLEWKETARWIKFEEDVEEGGEKWSKPHVASLSLHALFELKKGISTGIVLLNDDINNIIQLVDLLLRRWTTEKMIDGDKGEVQKVGELLLSRHRHQHEHHMHLHMPHLPRKGDHGMSKSTPNLVTTRDMGTQMTPNVTPNATPETKKRELDREDTVKSYLEQLRELDQTSSHKMRPNVSFMRHIPKGAEAANILVGTAQFLEKPIVAFVRLNDSCVLADITEVDIPTKFVFVILGPGGTTHHYREIGRCMSTLLSDEEFREIAYAAKDKEGLLQGIDQFLDEVIVLPPSEWDPSIRIEPPDKVPKRGLSKKASLSDLGTLPNGKGLEHINGSVPSFQESIDSEEVGGGHGDDPALARTGRLFGGLVADIKRKAPFYLSDFKDSLHIQCIASICYIYIAALTPIVTFGGLLSDATDNYMGAMEGILSGAITGVTFALFSGQPLNIIGATGPMLVFEGILYSFCESSDLNFLAFRFWIGMWCTFYLLLIVAFDLSALVKYITRFTEESFAALISVIFIYEAIEKVLEIEHEYGVDTSPGNPIWDNCLCVPTNETDEDHSNITVTTMAYDNPNYTVVGWNELNISRTDFREMCEDRGEHWELEGSHCDIIADVFFFSFIIFLGTFVLAYVLKIFKTSPFFPSKVREIVSDFNVVIAVVVMVLIDWATGLSTPKLNVPETFEPTHPDRGWVVGLFEGNPWWTCLAGALPALLATILIFMDQQITAVIVNRKENKLAKGVGYHLDLFILSLQIAACSILGLPWFVASTVIAVSHVISLGKESDISAPGEKAQFLGVRENRVTALFVGLLIGVSIYLTVVFKMIPMAVLYGVFLYMGISSLKGLQVIDRILLMFMPAKYQPDYMFLRHVKTYRVHIFTTIQLVSFGALWAVKGIHSISIAFPLMLLALCLIRKGLECIFSHREIAELDDTLPESHKREKEDKKKKKSKKHKVDVELHKGMKRQESRVQLEGGLIQIPLKGGKVMTVKAENVVYRPSRKMTPDQSEAELRRRDVQTKTPEEKDGMELQSVSVTKM